MNIDWLWPLLAGAVITYGAGALEAGRRQRDQRRHDGREHLLKAFELANSVVMGVHNKQSEQRFANDPVDYESTEYWELATLDELMPDPELRRAIQHACFVVRASRAAHELSAWQDSAGSIQREAMTRLRSLLGAAVRGERRLPTEDLQWLSKRAEEVSVAIDAASSS